MDTLPAPTPVIALEYAKPQHALQILRPVMWLLIVVEAAGGLSTLSSIGFQVAQTVMQSTSTGPIFNWNYLLYTLVSLPEAVLCFVIVGMCITVLSGRVDRLGVIQWVVFALALLVIARTILNGYFFYAQFPKNSSAFATSWYIPLNLSRQVISGLIYATSVILISRIISRLRDDLAGMK